MADFMTPQWAQEIQAVFNDWPGADRKASKLQDFWDWINMIRPFITGRLALVVRDMPDGSAADTLALDFEGGTVTAASVLTRAEAEPEAVFLLGGSYADWLDMLLGYDVGKMVMYRRLMLEKGDTLQFFTAAFFWTELLAAIQSVPAGPAETVGTAETAGTGAQVLSSTLLSGTWPFPAASVRCMPRCTASIR
jgi:hypothetical protein